MTDTVRPASSGGIAGALGRRPLLALLLALAIVPLALAGTLVMPIGPMYWDHYIYLDAANRIFSGQVPAVDFIAPAGALGYYLFSGVISLFPHGHPLLVASWSLLIVTAPLMALIVWDVQKRSAAIAYGILLPFLLYALVPFNTGDFYPYPGSDGFGIYNRQICQLLYVLAAGLVFVKNRTLLTAIAAVAMLSLLLVKVTGVIAGVVLCLMAFLAGRLTIRCALAAGLAFFIVLGLLEGTTGIVSAYAMDMLSLAEVNSSSFLPRLIQAASLNFGIVFIGAALCVILFVQDLAGLLEKTRFFGRRPGFTTFASLADQRVVWLAAFLLAGLLFESQNTGSQAFIFLWPLLFRFILDSYSNRGAGTSFAVVAVVSLAMALPPAVVVVQKAARAWVGAVQNTTIGGNHLKTLGAVGVRQVFALRADRLKTSYVEDRPAYQKVADGGELSSFLLFSDFDFQTLWLNTTNEAIEALNAYEAANGVRFESIMAIDFTNVFPWLMDRQAPKHIAIGADPFRAVPPPDQRTRDAVVAVDIALYPTCPPTTTRDALIDLYQPILAPGHTRVTLTPCFDAFIRNELLKNR